MERYNDKIYFFIVISLARANVNNKFYLYMLPIISSFIFAYTLILLVFIFSLNSIPNRPAIPHMYIFFLSYGIIFIILLILLDIYSRIKIYNDNDYLLAAFDLESKNRFDKNVLKNFKKAKKLAIQFRGHYIQSCIGIKDYYSRTNSNDRDRLLNLIDLVNVFSIHEINPDWLDKLYNELDNLNLHKNTYLNLINKEVLDSVCRDKIINVLK